MNALVARVHRPLSGLERAWLAADRIHPPFVNQLVLEGLGSLSLPLLERAVGLAAEANPGVCLRLKGILGFTRWLPDGPPPAVRAVDGGSWDGQGPDGAPFLKNPLDPVKGPVVEVLLVEGPDAFSPRLVLRSHHAALDGRGAWLFAADLFRALRGEELLGSEAGPWTDVDYARMAREDAIAEPRADRAAPTGVADSTELATTWTRLRVEGSFRGLMPRALVALWRASRRFTSAPLRFAIPVDLRRYRPDRRTTANLTGIMRVDLDEIEDLAQANARVRARLSSGMTAHHAAGQVILADRVQGVPLWLMARMGRKAARRSLQSGLFPVSATVSNLGRQDLSLVSAPSFRCQRAFWIPPGSPGMPLFLTLNGDAEGLDLVGSAPMGLASNGRLRGLLEAMRQALESERDRQPAESEE